MLNEGKQERLPIVAICYDFDKTLSPDDMQARREILISATLRLRSMARR